MEQQKIGAFLKELRHENGITQEQLAEKFHTTNRSVSRWENGKSMPDISTLLELAKFYNVDIREILQGERIPEEVENNTETVAMQIADYSMEQSSRLLIWIRRISIIGAVIMFVVLILETIGYTPSIPSFFAYGLSVFAFLIMIILALYTNGKLERLARNKNVVIACKVLLIAISFAVLMLVVRLILLMMLVGLLESVPYENKTGIENYDKAGILEVHGGDFDTGLFIFPDSTDRMKEANFASSTRVGLFDTDGYIILRAKYSTQDYQMEVERLSDIECTIYFADEQITQKVKYDTESYAYPAYVTIDGYDYVYEYALLNEEECEIIYVYLSLPGSMDMSQYAEYLKTDESQYEIEDVLHQFTIYAYSFDNGETWIEYSDN